MHACFLLRGMLRWIEEEGEGTKGSFLSRRRKSGGRGEEEEEEGDEFFSALAGWLWRTVWK